MKLNKIDEVWSCANSLFKWHFRFVVIQKCCYHGNVMQQPLSINRSSDQWGTVWYCCEGDICVICGCSINVDEFWVCSWRGVWVIWVNNMSRVSGGIQFDFCLFIAKDMIISFRGPFLESLRIWKAIVCLHCLNCFMIKMKLLVSEKTWAGLSARSHAIGLSFFSLLRKYMQ